MTEDWYCCPFAMSHSGHLSALGTLLSATHKSAGGVEQRVISFDIQPRKIRQILFSFQLPQGH